MNCSVPKTPSLTGRVSMLSMRKAEILLVSFLHTMLRKYMFLTSDCNYQKSILQQLHVMWLTSWPGLVNVLSKV